MVEYFVEARTTCEACKGTKQIPSRDWGLYDDLVRRLTEDPNYTYFQFVPEEDRNPIGLIDWIFGWTEREAYQKGGIAAVEAINPRLEPCYTCNQVGYFTSMVSLGKAMADTKPYLGG